MRGSCRRTVKSRLTRTLKEISISFRMFLALAMSIGLSTFLPVLKSNSDKTKFSQMEITVTQMASWMVFASLTLHQDPDGGISQLGPGKKDNKREDLGSYGIGFFVSVGKFYIGRSGDDSGGQQNHQRRGNICGGINAIGNHRKTAGNKSNGKF